MRIELLRTSMVLHHVQGDNNIDSNCSYRYRDGVSFSPKSFSSTNAVGMREGGTNRGRQERISCAWQWILLYADESSSYVLKTSADVSFALTDEPSACDLTWRVESATLLSWVRYGWCTRIERLVNELKHVFVIYKLLCTTEDSVKTHLKLTRTHRYESSAEVE